MLKGTFQQALSVYNTVRRDSGVAAAGGGSRRFAAAKKKLPGDTLELDNSLTNQPTQATLNAKPPSMSRAPWICRSCIKALSRPVPRQFVRFASNGTVFAV